MIGWLTGIVRVRDPLAGEVVLDVGGVGYQLVVSWQTLTVVPEVGEACELWIFTHVREDALLLFGFATPAEKRMFRLLTSVPQVGPKQAVAVLGGFPLVDLLTAIAGGERATLERIPGVGKRTAERILLDLKEKVEPLLDELATSDDRRPVAGTRPPADQLAADAQGVLTNLGWKGKQVEVALAKIAEEPDPPEDLDEWVRRALAKLMSR
jgi:Holliday junction DNA helicase RuvA